MWRTSVPGLPFLGLCALASTWLSGCSPAQTSEENSPFSPGAPISGGAPNQANCGGLGTGGAGPHGSGASGPGASSNGTTSNDGSGGAAGAPSTGALPANLFPNEPALPTNVHTEEGVIVTRVADRGRRRHEPSCISDVLGAGPDTCDFDNYHFMYWTHDARTLDWTIRDTVASGDGTIQIEIDMMSPHGQNGADAGQNSPNLRCFTQYGTVTGFYQNYAMQPLNGSQATATRFTHTLTSYSDSNAEGASRPLAVGDLLECEITMRWQELVDRGFQSNYYSRRIRYAVGRGGLLGVNRDPNVGPVSVNEAQLLGGSTTDSVRAPGERGRSFMQFALNGSHEELVSFLDGRRLFRTSFIDGHHHDPTGTTDPLPAQPTFTEAALGVTPGIADSAARCANCHINDGNGPRFPGMERAAPALLGVGLLEAILVEDLLENEAAQSTDGDPTTAGRLRRETRNGQVYAGRFGWLADAVTVEEQTVRALENEMGVSVSALPDGFLRDLANYVRLLAVPAPRATELWALPGAAHFTSFGCANCHLTRTYVTGPHPLQSLRAQTIQPFTDLLVHDLGEDDFRTTPLWGLGLKATVRGEARYWHDDSQTSLAGVIAAHGGEGAASRAAFANASAGERDELIAFLGAL